MTPRLDHYLGGQDSPPASNAWLDVFAPASGEVHARVAAGNAEDVERAVRAAKASLGATVEAVTNAKEQLRLAESRYTTGVGSIIELTDAQLGYAQAAAQAVQARYGLATARVQLLNALGRS